jgi:hypothetical protein
MKDSAPSEGGRANDALNFAKSAVESATAHVDEVGRHFSDTVEKARRPETYVELLKSATVAAPLAMLAAAFIVGVQFGLRRHRR